MKLKSVYVCSNCGETSPRWMGRCPSCGQLEYHERGRCSRSAQGGDVLLPGRLLRLVRRA